MVGENVGVKASIHATGLSSLVLCKRKWAWQYVAGLESEGSTATRFGVEVHRQLEEYVRHGRPIDFLTRPDEAECAQALLELLRREVPHFMTGAPERKFSRQMSGGAWEYAGTMDLEVPPSAECTDWTLVDYKTTSSISRWAKNETVLRGDPQPVVYAGEFFSRHPDVDRLRMLWLYVQRDNQETLPVSFTFTFSDWVKGALSLSGDVAWILETCARAPSRTFFDKTVAFVKSLPYDSSACSAFGGCEYAGRCQLGPADFFPLAGLARLR